MLSMIVHKVTVTCCCLISLAMFANIFECIISFLGMLLWKLRDYTIAYNFFNKWLSMNDILDRVEGVFKEISKISFILFLIALCVGLAFGFVDICLSYFYNGKI